MCIFAELFLSLFVYFPFFVINNGLFAQCFFMSTVWGWVFLRAFRTSEACMEIVPYSAVFFIHCIPDFFLNSSLAATSKDLPTARASADSLCGLPQTCFIGLFLDIFSSVVSQKLSQFITIPTLNHYKLLSQISGLSEHSGDWIIHRIYLVTKSLNDFRMSFLAFPPPKTSFKMHDYCLHCTMHWIKGVLRWATNEVSLEKQNTLSFCTTLPWASTPCVQALREGGGTMLRVITCHILPISPLHFPGCASTERAASGLHKRVGYFFPTTVISLDVSVSILFVHLQPNLWNDQRMKRRPR